MVTIGSTNRWGKRGWIAGAGLACLGAGGLLASGCTTTVADLHGSSKNQQVAGAKGSKTGGKADKQVASKDAPGKTRISDLDDESRVQMAAQIAARKAPTKSYGPALAAAQTQPPAAGPAPAAAVNAPQAAGQRPEAAAANQAIAAGQRRAAPGSASKQRSGNSVAASVRTPSGSITQTAGAGSPPAIAKRSSKSASQRPVITPRKSEWQPENGGETIASNHERRRADRLMARAHAMYENGYREEALRLASVAAELEASHQASYKRNEERPSDFIAQLQNPAARNSASPAYAEAQALAQQSSESAIAAPQVSPAVAESNKSQSVADGSRGRSRRDAAASGRLADRSSSKRSIVGLGSPATNTPHFAGGDDASMQAAANAGRMEVPMPPAPRSTETGVITADASLAIGQRSRKIDRSDSVVTADRLEEAQDPAESPKMLAPKAPSKSAPPAPIDELDADTDVAMDAESPTAAPAPTSQLTIASLIGLLTGVAGMIGLGWWRRKEREHYAGSKDISLRIQDPEARPRARRAA